MPIARILERLTDRQRSDRFRREVVRVMNEALTLGIAAQAGTLAIAEELKDSVLSIVARTDFEVFNLAVVNQNLEAAIGVFGSDMAALLSRVQGEGFEAGAAILDRGFRLAGVTLQISNIPQSQLLIIRANNAELITRLNDEVRRFIRGQILLVNSGAQGLFNAQVQIANALSTIPGAAKVGRFGSLTERARAIVRTEVKSAQELAAHVRREQYIRSGVEGLRKQWNFCFSRPGHLRLNGKDIPHDQRFQLRGADGILYRPLFPRDRWVLPAGESVNCAGVTLPVKRSWREFDQEGKV